MQTTRVFLRIGVFLGALFTCGPLVGILSAFLGIGQMSHRLGQRGIDDPHQLSTAVARTFLITASGFVLFPIGIILLTVCLLLLRRLHQTGLPPPPRFPENE